MYSSLRDSFDHHYDTSAHDTNTYADDLVSKSWLRVSKSTVVRWPDIKRQHSISRRKSELGIQDWLPSTTYRVVPPRLVLSFDHRHKFICFWAPLSGTSNRAGTRNTVLTAFRTLPIYYKNCRYPSQDGDISAGPGVRAQAKVRLCTHEID